MSKFQKKKFNDLGLGEKASQEQFRAVNKDGSFNVRKTNVPFPLRFNFFHTLISISWLKFIAFILTCYFLVNVLFASIYFLIGVEHLTITKAASPYKQFLEAFFFSAQTITTLGYGRVAPIGILANTIAAIESMMGLLAFALATGLLYGRFSKPSATIQYSEKAVIAPYQDINAFMFRIVNPQNNQLLEAEVKVSVALRRTNTSLRDFFELNLERSQVSFLSSTWTIVHPIDEESPLHTMTKKQIQKRDAEFIIIIKAFDESFSQHVYSRSSYKANELEWAAKFVNLMQTEDGGMLVDVSKLSETHQAELN